MGSTDKIVRLVLAAVLLILFFTNVVSGTLGIIALIVAAIFIGTSFINFCPLYLPFGISTRPKSKE